MITLDQTPDGHQLLIRGRRIRRDRAGNHVVQFDRIKFESLSTLPAGTSLVLERGEGHRTHEDLIVLDRIVIVSPTKVRAYGDHFRCPGCWEHALSRATYMEIAEGLLTSIAAERAGVRFEGLVLDKEDHLHQLVSVELDIASPTMLEQSLSAVVVPLLRPLLDLKERMDEEVGRLFGI